MPTAFNIAFTPTSLSGSVLKSVLYVIIFGAVIPVESSAFSAAIA